MSSVSKAKKVVANSSSATNALPKVNVSNGKSPQKGTKDKQTADRKAKVTTETLPAISPIKNAAKSSTITEKTEKVEIPSTTVDAETTVTISPTVDLAADETDSNMSSVAVSSALNDGNTEVASVPAAEPAVVSSEPVLEVVPTAEDVTPPRVVNGNGKVVLIYEQYNEEFEISDGKTTQENIDEVYCLSFVMPNCLVHLSVHAPVEKRRLETEEGAAVDDLFLKEDPRGMYHGMEAGSTYYVYVEQEADQLARDQEKMRQIAETMEGGSSSANAAGDRIVRDDGRVMESCSCVYGNPCVDEYGCKDWDNRAAVATANGWKGF